MKTSFFSFLALCLTVAILAACGGQQAGDEAMPEDAAMMEESMEDDGMMEEAMEDTTMMEVDGMMEEAMEDEGAEEEGGDSH